MIKNADHIEIPEVSVEPNVFGRKQHFLIQVSGIVQGVGFRPFVYRLACRLDLCGSVRNHSGGVEIHVEGNLESLQEFIRRLSTEAPEASRITHLRAQQIVSNGFADFRITESEARAGQFTQLPADLALCSDCRAELLNPADRRYRYPFINCTNCGPRFTIIRHLPYDRPETTMADFTMCAPCASEYHEPRDRRYHAQPVACPECGPHLSFMGNAGGHWEKRGEKEKALCEAVKSLRDGQIVLIQGIGGFHLACDAQNPQAVNELRRRKQRDEKPFAVMYASLKDVQAECEVDEVERSTLVSAAAPIVLLKKRETCRVVKEVAPRNPWLGVLLPYSPLHVLLLGEFGGPLVMTSANLSDEPIAYRVDGALDKMKAIADAALVHDRPIHMFADDSVARVIDGKCRLMRRARGYVPRPMSVPVAFRVPVLAFGADLKNTFCLGSDQAAILSQHLGDLDSEHAVLAEQDALRHFLHLFGDHVRAVSCDLHPDYASTRLAEEWSRQNDVPLIRVQHHHAHLASCLAENGETGPAVGLCLDGTGYGTDGTIWGGEILVGGFDRFERVAHLETVPMPGGERAAREPWRMALAWLHRAYGEELYQLRIPLIEELREMIGEPRLRALLNERLMREVYSHTSSLGRLFDAIAALITFGTRSQFEGQAAMELEGIITPAAESGYRLKITRRESDLVLSPVPMFREVVNDLLNGVSPGRMARRFHEGVAQAFCSVAARAAQEKSHPTVALSGGCFQNVFLLTRCTWLLREAGLRVLTHQDVPMNDGGISLGQACIANARMK